METVAGAKTAASLFALQCGVQPYAWGSKTLMAERFGWQMSSEPQAELWIGAHSLLPSSVLVEGVWFSLLDAIAAAPERWLGSRVLTRFGPMLPMLMKVLAIGQPLSLQAHPSPTQAAEGFAREEALGIAQFAPERSYKDNRAKPELICALTVMETLCGFRDVDESAMLLRSVGGSIGAMAEELVGPADLPRLVGSLLRSDVATQRALVGELLQGASQLPGGVGSLVRQLADRYPGDVGVVVAVLLNQVTLAPGEALFLPAGNMHAYLSGLGVEVMANSDNVLRGGLTPKHVDIPALLETLLPVAGPWPKALSRSLDGVTHWTTDAAEVALSCITASSLSQGSSFGTSDGPTLLVVSDGTVLLTDPAEGSLELGAGDAAYAIPGAEVVVRGFGTVWQSSVNFDAA